MQEVLTPIVLSIAMLDNDDTVPALIDEHQMTIAQHLSMETDPVMQIIDHLSMENASLRQPDAGASLSLADRQPDAAQSLDALHQVIDPGSLFVPSARLGYEDTQKEARSTVRGGIANIIAAFFLENESGDEWIVRVAEIDEQFLNYKLELLLKEPLPFVIDHELMQVDPSVICVPLFKQLSLRLDDKLLAAKSPVGHFMDFNFLPDTRALFLHEGTGAALARACSTVDWFVQAYQPARIKIGVAGNILVRWREGYVQLADEDTSLDFERFVLLYASGERGAAEMLEAALLRIYEGVTINSCPGGEGHMPGWAPFFVYMAVDCAGSPPVRRRGHYHGRT
jgi:hypothetical protein